MALPINIEDLIHGKAVEWERLEFKRNWNPETIVHSMCAFANDLNNWGGGYIIVGIDEDNGKAVLPPEGIVSTDIDHIQGEILRLAHQVLPNYFPITQPYVLQDKHILVMWCPAGDNRPYTVPSTQGVKSQRYPYVRVGSHSIIAKDDNLVRLNTLAQRIPFDDRVNQQATINDLDLGTIRAYLQEVKSDLFDESSSMAFDDLCRAMFIAKGASENLLPLNVGLLFFSKQPDKFFPRTWIELVWHTGTRGKEFREYYFKGALHIQLRDALAFLKNNIIAEQVVKHSDRAEAERFYNFPYDAVEEALSNAVYHKSYELGAPIEVQVWDDKIEILSYPSPMPPVDANALSKNRRIVARDYRNRRIGDFLKELRLTEGRGTGFPTIYDAMADNGSPAPIFETDEKTYVLVTLPVHSALVESNQVSNQVSNQENDLAVVQIFSSLESVVAFCDQANDQANDRANDRANDQVSDQVSDQVNQLITEELGGKVGLILGYVQEQPRSKKDILFEIGLKNHTDNRKKHIDPLYDYHWIEFTIPENPTHQDQKYKITSSGLRLLNLIKR